MSVVLPRVIRRPMVGPDVEAVRRILIRTPFRKPSDPGGVARPMGALLEAQIREFQRHHAIPPSGVVGSATWRKFYSLGIVRKYEELLVNEERAALLRDNQNRVAHLVVEALLQGASSKWEPTIHYSQKQNLRWRGIELDLLAPDNQPDFADCSAYTTWAIWQALVRVHGEPGPDVINGENWKGGFTGTQLEHGHQVPFSHAQPGRSLIFYTAVRGGPVTHVVGFVGTIPGHGTNCVVSHGQENGPRLARANYRDYYHSTRTYPI